MQGSDGLGSRDGGGGMLQRKPWRGRWGLQKVKGSQHGAQGQRGLLKDVTTRLTCGWESQA